MAAATFREPHGRNPPGAPGSPSAAAPRGVAPVPRPPARVLAATRCPWRRRARWPRGATAKGGYRPELPGGVAGACSPSRRGARRRGAASAVSRGGCGRRRRAKPGRSRSSWRRPGLAGGRIRSEPRPRRIRATRRPRSRRATVEERQRSDRATGCATDACEPPRAPRRRAAMAPRSRAETAASGETGPPGTEAPRTRAEGEAQAPMGATGGIPATGRRRHASTRPRNSAPAWAR